MTLQSWRVLYCCQIKLCQNNSRRLRYGRFSKNFLVVDPKICSVVLWSPCYFVPVENKIFPSEIIPALDVREGTSCLDIYLSVENTLFCICVESQTAIDPSSALLFILQKVLLSITDGAHAPRFPVLALAGI